MSRVHTRHIGPLARVIIKHASEQTSDLEQFYALVAERISSESDREACLRDARTR